MHLHRFYIDQPLYTQDRQTLVGETAHYLLHVLRVKPGQRLELFNGDGYHHAADVETIKRHEVVVTIQDSIQCPRESPLSIHLAMVMLKRRINFALQKAVELGVTSVTLLCSERSSVRFKPDRLNSKLTHWRKIITSACEQSGRATVPVLKVQNSLEGYIRSISSTEAAFVQPSNSGRMKQEQPCNLQKVEACDSESTLKLILSPTGTTDLRSHISMQVECIHLLIGSEGGWTEEELATAEQQGFLSMGLGPRILRSETAVLTAMSLLQYQWGDLSPCHQGPLNQG